MKVDGGLSIVTGPMGSGKTLYEVRGGVERMLTGGWWITNIPLHDLALRREDQPFDGGYAAFRRIARHAAPASRSKRERVMRVLDERYIYCDDLYTALHHGVKKRDRRPGEALARLGWDESYSELNAREWDGGRGKSKDDRAELFENVPMLRKLGVHCYLLSQHDELLDRNARRVCNWNVALTNQRENMRIFGMKLSFLPPLFLASYYPANAGQSRMKAMRPMLTERHLLTWHRNIYDTHGLMNGLERDDVEGNVIWLGYDQPRARLSPGSLGQAAPALPPGTVSA